MHETAMECGRQFFASYWRPEFKYVLDIGAMDVNGTLRSVRPQGCDYIGVDLTHGPGVDIVLGDPYRFPYPDGHFDMVVSTSCYEHDRFFWLTFAESCRVLSAEGCLYINAPSTGVYHAYPHDHWRFYADAGVALEAWGRRVGQQVRLVESFQIKPELVSFGDNVMVFTKSARNPEVYMSSRIAGAELVRLSSRGDFQPAAA